MSNNYLTVTALTKYVKRKLDMDQHLQSVWLKGEISNFKHHSRGHMYMTIKDKNAQIKAVMFQGNNQGLTFKPENGMMVLIKGEVSVYEPYGQYQLYIRQMEPDGIGSLYLAYEQLKKKLAQNGYFNEEHKQPIPRFPTHIGVLTSPTGAAVRDIITTIKRRYPIVRLTIFPVLVQGEGGAATIKKAIETANRLGGFDCLIVGRGGGSIEDLWNFNEEEVAHAIYRSMIPIISAVGHETDFTISDFVSDLRAPTPTGAAEIAVPSQIELKEKIQILKHSLTNQMGQLIRANKEHLKRIRESYAFRYPAKLLRQKEQELDHDMERLTWTMKQVLKTRMDTFSHLEKRLYNQHAGQKVIDLKKDVGSVTKRLNQTMEQLLRLRQQSFAKTIEKLTILNPLETMKRGYAISYQQDGTILKTVQSVKKDDQVKLKLHDGTLDCQVLMVREDKHNG